MYIYAYTVVYTILRIKKERKKGDNEVKSEEWSKYGKETSKEGNIYTRK